MGLIVAFVLLLLLVLAGCGALGTYALQVDQLDTVYPGVSVKGIDLSGMTRAQAGKALEVLGAEKYNGLTVTAQLPLDNSLTISAWDARLTYSAEEAAQAAFDYGRNGTYLENAWTYFQADKLGKTDFAWEGELQVDIDEEAIRQIVANAAEEIDRQLLTSGVEILDDQVRLTKGAIGLTIDEQEVTNRFKTALLSGSGEGFTYEAEPEPDQEYDFQGLYDGLYQEYAEAHLYYARDYGLAEETPGITPPDTLPENEQNPEPLPEGFDFQGKPYGISRSNTGVSFDMDRARAQWDAAAYGETVVIPLDIREPEVTTEYYENLLFGDNLSKNWTMVRLWNREYCEEVRTSLSGSSKNRISNVKKACELLNGLILMPGDTFSYNFAIGMRTEEGGWLPAPAYANGTVRQEAGGGICQVSSTLYNAALYSNLEIVDRTCHQFQVGYLPWGMDATVSWGWPDFKFRNTKDYPIMIVAWVDEGTNECCIQIKGTDTEHQYVIMRFANWEIFDNTGRYHDANGNPVAVGMGASTWRVVYNDGDDWRTAKPVSEEYEAYSTYNYHTEDIEARSVG